MSVDPIPRPVSFAPPNILASAWARVCHCVAIGGAAAAADPAVIRTLGARRVLKLYEGRPHKRHAGIRYLVVGLRDSADFDARPHLARCIRFIRRGIRRDEITLVHCQMGVSRSAAVVLLHLMIDHGLSLNDAAAHLSAVHPQASPNAGLTAILMRVDARLKKSSMLLR